MPTFARIVDAEVLAQVSLTHALRLRDVRHVRVRHWAQLDLFTHDQGTTMTTPRTIIPRNRLGLFFYTLFASHLAVGCDASSGTTTTVSCPAGSKRCSCYADDTCDKGLVCMSDVCVAAKTEGTGGNTQNTSAGGGQNETGGTPATVASGGTKSTATGGATSAETGGTTSTATGGATGLPTSGGTTNVTSTGGATTVATGGSTVVASGGSTTVATGGSTSVSNSPIIDAFATCDDRIENNAGRNGKWYYFADSDFNATHSYGDPGTQWADHGCAAWMILGCTGTACTYAGLGFQLADGNPYDLSRYSGISVSFEGKDNVYFVVKTSDGGYFGTWLTGATGNQTRNADFADLSVMANSAVTTLNTRLVTEMQFTVGKSLALNAGFGLAIHSVSLR